MNITHVGVDLAKNVFQVHGVDERGHRKLDRRLRRDRGDQAGGEQQPHRASTSAIDSSGLACSVTISAGYGSGVMPPGTGIWLNNSLAYCTFEPAGNPDGAAPGSIAVAGGTGFVGGEIARELRRRGRHVIVLSSRGEAARGQLPDDVVLVPDAAFATRSGDLEEKRRVRDETAVTALEVPELLEADVSAEA